MNKQLFQDLKNVWDYQKLMNLDFRGGTRGYLLKKFNLTQEQQLNTFFGAGLVRNIGGYHVYHTIAQVSLQGDEDSSSDWDRCIEVYSFNELIEEVEKYSEKYPKETIEVHIGYEKLELNSEGRMDLCGKSDTHRHHILLKNDKMIVGKVDGKKLRKEV